MPDAGDAELNAEAEPTGGQEIRRITFKLKRMRSRLLCLPDVPALSDRREKRAWRSIPRSIPAGRKIRGNPRPVIPDDPR
jgi:hypothetical protein